MLKLYIFDAIALKEEFEERDLKFLINSKPWYLVQTYTFWEWEHNFYKNQPQILLEVKHGLSLQFVSVEF